MKIPRRYEGPESSENLLTSPNELTRIAARILHQLLCEFYEDMPNHHASSQRNVEKLLRQFEVLNKDSRNDRAKQQEAKFWAALIKEFMDFQDPTKFNSTFDQHFSKIVQDILAGGSTAFGASEIREAVETMYSALLQNLKSKSIQLDPRFPEPFAKSLWAGIEHISTNL
jgi:hypothetical protein